MKIRQARADDARPVAEIHNAVIRDTLVTFTTTEKDVSAVAAEIDTRGPAFLVAEASGEVVGFATYAPFRAGPGYAQTMEHTIHLRPTAQRRGIGRALMSELEGIARGQGVHSLIAGISGANPRAVTFHRALGFAEVGRLPEVGFKAGRWLDLILMQKIL